MSSLNPVQPGPIEKEEIHYEYADEVDFDVIEATPQEVRDKQNESISKDFKQDENGQIEGPEDTTIGDDSSISKAGSEKEDPKEEAKVPQKEEGQEATEEEPQRTIRVKHGGEDIRLPEEATFICRVDGKDQVVSAKDLREGHVRALTADKRFNEANRVKQEFETKNQKLESMVTKNKESFSSFLDNIKNYRVMDAMADLCELTGEDFQEAVTAFRNMQTHTQEQNQAMTQEELELQRMKDENEFLKRRSEKEKDRTTKESQRVKEEANVKEAMKKFDVSWDEMVSTYELINKNPKMVNGQEVTAERVGEVALDLRIWRQIDNIVTTEFPSKRNDNDFYGQILYDTKQHGLTENDWREVIQSIKKDKNSQESSIKRKAAKTRPSPTKKDSYGDPGSQGDYEEYEDWDSIK